MSNVTLTNDIAKAYSRAASGLDNVTGMIRDAIASNKLDTIGEAYGQLFDKFGKRSRIPKADGGGFTESTKADTFNTLVQRVTKDSDIGKHKPVQIEETGAWTLAPVESKPKAKSVKSLEKSRDAYVNMVNTMNDDEKLAELVALAELIGVEVDIPAVDEEIRELLHAV